jgi:hypothetical protein
MKIKIPLCLCSKQQSSNPKASPAKTQNKKITGMNEEIGILNYIG